MSRFLLSIVLASVAQARAATLSVAAFLQQGGFEKFVAHYQRDYLPGSSEYLQRSKIFQQRVELMDGHNSNPKRLWTAGISHLTDRSDLEMTALYGWKPHGGRQVASLLSTDVHVTDVREAATSIDWNNLTMATKKFDQGGCGSCWAVATAVMLEARHEAQLGKTRSFSAQQLVNCVPNPKECGGQGGCAGATVELAMIYAQKHGLGDAVQVPYKGLDLTCKDSQSSSFLSVSSGTKLGLDDWKTLPENKANALMIALLDGPVAISVGADAWGSYSTGIFNSCGRDAVINHAVVLFGYGEQEQTQTKYWNIRNSWGGEWGEAGHIRLLRHKTAAEDDAYCGWDHKPEDGIACKPYPKKQFVCGMCGMLFDSVSVKFSQPAV